MKQGITAIILTFNESQHIRRCIESVQDFCQDVIVVDSFSSDDTQAIVESMGGRFYQNVFVNHANQFNWALDSIDVSTQWIIRVDADEYVESALKTEIIEALKTVPEMVNGFYLRRKYFFLGKWIRFGAMYPVEVMRMWRTGTGYVEQRWMDEHVVLKSGDISRLKGNIVDDNLNNVSWWVDKHNKYATLEMIELLNLKYQFSPSDNAMKKQAGGHAKLKRWIKQDIYTKLPAFVRPLMYFLYRYFF